MKIRTALPALALALAAGPSAAQLSTDTRLGSILQAIRLPKATQEARVLGVPEPDIRVILDRARAQQLPPAVVTEVMEGSCESMREHGPIDNFGAFVQGKLDQGLRGRELAAAIKAEHAARGKGKGHLKHRDDHGDDHGHDHDAMAAPGGPNAVKGRERAAQPGGKPDAAGKPGAAGKSDEAKGKKGGGR